MFAGWEKREGGRKRKAYLRTDWNRERRGEEEQRPDSAGAGFTRFQS